MSSSTDTMVSSLKQALNASFYATTHSVAGDVHNLRRLSGGANMETWSLDWQLGEAQLPLILRRLPAGSATDDDVQAVSQIDLTTEAELVALAGEHGVAVAQVIEILQPQHQLGVGYVMTREGGEALPQKLLRDPRYSEAMQGLAYRCGQELARIHQIPVEQVPASVARMTVAEQLDVAQGELDRFGNESPVHQLALNWLRDNINPNSKQCLVHGDFRNGNLLVVESGLSAVLDWELAHVGDPAEDLGYLCANVWRFGISDKPVGGFGAYEDLLNGYRSVMGSAPSIDELIYWQVYGALNWGICCMVMLDMYRTGRDRSLERAAIGRRMSESEIDLLVLLDGRLQEGAGHE